MNKIFIDGQVGTTGLQIHERLSDRQDIEILSISDKNRKDPTVKHAIICEADIVILCLPDDAARETASLASDTSARILDASTAHRILPDWVYGLPELTKNQRQKISEATRVSNPGCYPTGFLLSIAPLVNSGLLRKDIRLSISAVSGYSGGGHKMIEQYELRQQQSPTDLWNSRPYALNFGHKHVPEMQHYASLTYAPLFLPSVGHYPQGMLVSTPLAKEYFNKKTSLDDIYTCLETHYSDNECVNVHQPNTDETRQNGFLDPQTNNGTNRNDIHIFGSDDQMLVISQLDNLGKGAAGASVQNMNLMLGADELTGLKV